MSADNGIYILATPIGNGQYEYRVIHAMAIENITDNDINGDPEVVMAYFGNAPVFTSHDEALKHAKHLASSVPILQYGIVDIDLPYPFSHYILVACGPAQR